CISAAASERRRPGVGSSRRPCSSSDQSPRARCPGLRGAGGVEPGPRIGAPVGADPPETLESGRGQSWGTAGGGNRGPRRFGAGEAVRRQAAAAGAEATGVADSEEVGEVEGDLGEKLSGASDAGKEGGEGREEASTNRGSARIRARRVAAGGPVDGGS
ncbi:unnamed protein product, partial [Urochloa humidicola]